MATLNLRVLIQAVDKATSPLRNISKGLGGLTRPAKAAGMALKSIGRDLRNLAMIGAAAGAAVAAGLWTMVRRTADAGDAALLAAQKTGVQIESYQRLAYAAGLANVASEEFDTGLKFLNQSIDAAGQGSKRDAKAFADLGIKLKGSNGQLKNTEALLIEVADRFKTMPDGPRKTAVAMAIFGRSGVDMIPMLNEGGAAIRKWGEEAQAAGLVLSEQAAKDADEFNDSLDRLKLGVFGLGNQLMTGLLPQLTQLIERARTFIAANKPEIIRQMTKVVGELSAAAPDLISALMSLVQLIAAIGRVVGPVVKALGGFGTVLDILAGIMVGRLAIAIWMAVKAVWGLNAAMYANPIGLIIAAIAALVFAGWMLYRNWDKVVAFFKKAFANHLAAARLWVAAIKRAWSSVVGFFTSLGPKINAAFRLAISALWALLPPWLKTIFRGGAFVLRVAGNGLGGGGPAAGGGPTAPKPAVGPGSRGPRDVRVGVDVRTRHDGPPRVNATVSGADGTVTTDPYRGGGVD